MGGPPLNSARRRWAGALIVFAVVALLAGCGSGSGSSSSSSAVTTGRAGTTGTVGGSTLASTMVFGSGSECPHEPYCLPGLQETYGLTFTAFVVTDSGGQKTVDALKDGSIQAGILFTTDPSLTSNGLVLLTDDKHLQPAENVTPILNAGLQSSYGSELTDLINRVSAPITTELLTELNHQVKVEGKSSADAAKGFLQQRGFSTTATARKTGSTIVVGSANFAESTTLAEIYAQALEGAGFPVERKLSVGSRSTYFPLVQSGEVGLFPEYVGSLLGYLDPNATESSDSAQAHAALVTALNGSGLVALHAAPAEDKNAVAVTKATADRYHLTKVSDLGRPSG